jgi:hypothetical protein
MANETSQPLVTSSQEPAWAPEARECYQQVVQGLLQAEVPFAISGGFAFQRHTGIWRATKDLDLVMTPDAVSRAFDVLRDEGFETYIQDPVWLAKARRGDYFVDIITGVGNATLAVEQDWIDRAIPDEVLGIPCRVLRAEELIASKLFVTRRERFDGADIAHLIRSCGAQLDWRRLLRLAGPYWQMLFWHLVLFDYIYPSRKVLVPESVWNELLLHFSLRLQNSANNEPSRGSLIDPKMFAIDVNEWCERDLYRELTESYPHTLRVTNATRGKE